VIKHANSVVVAEKLLSATDAKRKIKEPQRAFSEQRDAALSDALDTAVKSDATLIDCRFKMSGSNGSVVMAIPTHMT
jgi:hypothetical protein